MAAALPKPEASPATVPQKSLDEMGTMFKGMIDKAMGNQPTAKSAVGDIKSLFGGLADGAMNLGGLVLGSVVYPLVDVAGSIVKNGKGKGGGEQKPDAGSDFAASIEDLGGLFNRIRASAASGGGSPELKIAERTA